MSFDVERLYELLPAIYRIRDIQLGRQQADALTAAEAVELANLEALENSDASLTEPQSRRLQELRDRRQRGPLKALLSIIAEQVAVLEENLAQLYDDQFIETCAPWVIPYIADLVGARGLLAFQKAGFTQRALVANTLAYRRRKGTAAMLEQLARDLTGWDASVVEFFQLLATTQYLNHTRPNNLSFADLRHSQQLDYLNTPFDRTAHTVDVRNVESRGGRYNIPNVGIFLWRLGSYSITAGPAFKLDDRRYLFDALGKDVQLYNQPEAEEEIAHLAEPVNVPMPLNRRVLDRYLETYYGRDKSILIYRDGQELTSSEASPPGKESDLVQVCDLSDLKDSFGNVAGWAHAPEDKVAIDPVLGRIAFPAKGPPPESVQVTYHYGFSAEIGGGEYERGVGAASKIIKVPSSEGPSLELALAKLIEDLKNSPDVQSGIVEIEKPASAADSHYHRLSGSLSLPAGKKVIVRASDEHRPVILVSGDLEIVGGQDSEMELDGLLMTGGRVRVPGGENQLHALRLSHCTLTLDTCSLIKSPPLSGLAPCLLVEALNTRVEMDRCILRSHGEVIQAVDGAHICVTASILDAGADTARAYAGTSEQQPGAPLVVVNSTIIGRVWTLKMELASNTLFFSRSEGEAPVRAEMLQEGCVRFCYVPPGSRLPRQFECQPQTPEEAARIRPVFASLRYGDAAYCQLSARCSEKILSGADDEAEIGVFHDLYQPQRLANLRARLGEFLRFNLEIGSFEAS